MILKKPSKEQREEILKNLGMTEDDLTKDAQDLRAWLESQPHIPPLDSFYNETFFKSFLVGCKNRMEVCKEKLDRYFTVRSELKHIFDRDPLGSGIQRSLDLEVYLISPKMTPDGERLCFLKRKDPIMEVDELSVIKRIANINELRFRMDDAWSGDNCIVDCDQSLPGHLIRIRPDRLVECLFIFLKAFPVKLKKIIIINAPPVFESIITKLIKPLLAPKLAERVFIHSEGGSILKQYFPVEILPKDYGGEEDTLENLSMLWQKETEKIRDWLITNGTLCVDESRRVKKDGFPGTSNFGVEGSFRKLAID